jgi:hypothetical protein
VEMYDYVIDVVIGYTEENLITHLKVSRMFVLGLSV